MRDLPEIWRPGKLKRLTVYAGRTETAPQLRNLTLTESLPRSIVVPFRESSAQTAIIRCGTRMGE
jgi:hypothetical protein